jgi:2-oxoisovalerate dehydrogenase E1 component
MATHITLMCFDDLDGPVQVVGARNWITPPTEIEEMFFPQSDWILDCLHEKLLPLPNYTTKTMQIQSATLQRNKLGV